MKQKEMLKLTTGMLLFSSTIFISFAQAQNYVSTSQINAANGVAGLNASKQVTADINSNEQFVGRIILKEQSLLPDKDHPDTNAPDPSASNFFRFLNPSQPPIDLFYNTEARVDPWKNKLDANTFYFSNHRGGNSYQFVGNMAATRTIFAPEISAKSIKNGYELDNPYRHSDRDSITRLTDDQYNNDVFVRRNTLMIGGKSRASYSGIKATCQNTGQGDLGGSCYQFTDMAGEQGLHRSGAGFTDGINMDIRSGDNSPVDVIGGNTLIKNTDGTFTVTGNNYPIAENVSAGTNTFKIQGTFGCGLAGLKGSNKTGCQMTGVNILDGNGQLLKGPIPVTPGEYDSKSGTTVVNLPASYKVGSDLTLSNTANIIFYSADGVAYAVENTVSGAKIYPALSEGERNLIHSRMAIWSNIADGMADTEGNSKEGGSNIDMPNYYYGYQSGIDTSNNKYTQVNLETFSYPDTGGQGGWRKISMKPEDATAVDFAPGDVNNKKDAYDYKIQYVHPNTKETVFNHNFHQYNQPALFLGLNQKNFNIYTLQTYDRSADSITREFDNEWDFWIHSPRDYAVNTRGLTLTWGFGAKNSEYQHKFAYGSYMLNLNGGGFMPDGIKINGVYDKGRLITSDSGFSIFKHSITDPTALDSKGKYVMINTLGQAQTNQGAYQLLTYVSNDSNSNYSMHLGLTKRDTGDNWTNLDYNQSPDCSVDNPDMAAVGRRCNVSGQVIFSPAGYDGGIGLGVGMGINTQIGLVINKSGDSIVKNSLYIEPNKLLFFKSSNNVHAVYLYGTEAGDIQIGTQVGNGANVRGVNTYYGKNIMLSQQVSASKFHSELSTPSSSSEACSAGDFKDDVNYHYVCVATNKWKRVALSSF